MVEEKRATRAGAAKIIKFMGKRTGQTLDETVREFKELTDDDVEQLRSGIENETLTY